MTKNVASGCSKRGSKPNFSKSLFIVGLGSHFWLFLRSEPFGIVGICNMTLV